MGIIILPQRHPLVLAKELASVDELSGCVLATWIIRSKTSPARRRKICFPCLPPKGGPSDKQRKVGVQSDVVDSILIFEQRCFHLMENLLVWLVFL
jgi:hypothetical protein